MGNQKCTIFVGTYTEPILFGTGQILEGKGKGIYCFDMDLESGKMTSRGEIRGVVNPSYLTLSPDHKMLYAVNELKKFQGQDCGAVSSFKVDPETLGLTFINQQPTGGTDPCHVVLNDAGSHVYVSNFMSGSVCVFPVEKDGALGSASQFIQHHGSSVNPKRQAGPHAHSLIFDPSNDFAFVPDLGIDKLVTYKTDFVNGKLLPNNPDGFVTEPGAGPRHCVFHPNGIFCYLIYEISCELCVLIYDPKTGSFRGIQTVPTVVDAFEGVNTCADIQITPDGQFVYGSNRGRDSIIIYKVDQQTGELHYVGTESSGGEIPRNFAIDPTGRYMLVANQDTDNIVVFAIDKDKGTLTQVEEVLVPTPVCVKPYLM